MFDAKAFIKDHFGGAKQMHIALEESGFNPPVADSVAKWELRDSIPGQFLAASLTLLEREVGGPVSLNKYVKKGNSQCQTSAIKRHTVSGEQPDIFG